jgi:NADH-quinone oxidoreductase subunit K
MITEYLIFSMLLFVIGIAGLIFNRNNLITLLMCIELLLLAANTNFVIFSQQLGSILGQVYVFFVITIAAAESVIGLALLVLMFRLNKSIDVTKLNHLKG